MLDQFVTYVPTSLLSPYGDQNIILLPAQGKILRVYPHVTANFIIVDSNHRLPYNCIKNTTVKNVQGCVQECILNENCTTFNLHKEKGICELLNISKFDAVGLIRWSRGWTHYETDDNAKLIGPVCQATSPCKSYQVCEDTYQPGPGYNCKCRDDFEGDGCKVFKGIGSAKNNPAPSCRFILKRYKDIPGNWYWVKSNANNKTKCEHIVDGGFTSWSTYTDCTVTCDVGIQFRTRDCSNPTPKGGGKDCVGTRNESRICGENPCPIVHECDNTTTGDCAQTCTKDGNKPVCSCKSIFEPANEAMSGYKVIFERTFFKTADKLKKANLLDTIPTLFKDWQIEFEVFPISFDNKLKFTNLIHLTTNNGSQQKFGQRIPAVYFKQRPNGSKSNKMVFNCFNDKNETRNFRYVSEEKHLSRWIKVIIKQFAGIHGYVYVICIDGKEVYRQDDNNQPQIFNNVQIYASKTNPLDGKIRNLKIKTILHVLKWAVGSDRTKGSSPKIGHGPEKAIDGNISTWAETSVTTGDAFWWGRLMNISTIDIIELYLPTQYDGHRNLKIYTADDVIPKSFSSNSWKECKNIGKPTESPLTVKFDGGATTANMIKISNNGNLKLNEVKVYGSTV